MRSIYADRRTVTINGVEYEWGGGFGSVLVSIERGAKVGMTRVIGNTLLHAYSVRKRWFGWRQVNWVPVEEFTSEWIHEFRHALFM